MLRAALKIIATMLLIVILHPIAAEAQSMKNFVLGANSVPCVGSNQQFQYPGGIVGGGVYPTVPFSIVGASISVSTNDPYSEAMAGQLGPNGDALVLNLIGKGAFGAFYPSGKVIPNDATLANRIDVNALCHAGYWMNVWVYVWYTIP